MQPEFNLGSQGISAQEDRAVPNCASPGRKFPGQMEGASACAGPKKPWGQVWQRSVFNQLAQGFYGELGLLGNDSPPDMLALLGSTLVPETCQRTS